MSATGSGGVTRRTPGARRRRVLGAAAGAAGAAGLLGAGALGAGAQSLIQDELHIVSARIAPGLDPTHEFSDAVATYMRAAGAAEALLRVTPGADVDVDLASAYEMLDPNTWRVSLRPNATFWSGRPVDAAAVVESLERSRSRAAPAAALLAGVRVEADGDLAVRFQAETPIPGLPLNIANEWLAIHNARSYGPAINSFDVGAADLTGPFRITAFEPGQRMGLVRNERHWGVQPRMARVRIEEVADNEARDFAAIAGEAHSVGTIASSVAGQIERGRAMRLVSATNASTGMVYLNTQKPPFDDVRVRQALAWGVDREEMVELAHDGRGTPYPSWLAAHPGYPEAKRVGYTRYDPQRAAQLLDEAGWRLPAGGRTRARDGAPLKFRLYWFGLNRPQAEVLQAQWGKLGAEVEVQGTVDAAFTRQRRADNDWEAFIEQWNTVGDIAVVLNRHVGADGTLNYARFRDARLDSLLAGFNELVDPDARRDLALQINARQAEVVPFVPIASQDRLTAVGLNVRNYIPHFTPWVYEVHPDLWVAV